MKKFKILLALMILAISITGVYAQNQNVVHITKNEKLIQEQVIPTTLEIEYENSNILPIPDGLYNEYFLLKEKKRNGILKTKVERKNFSYTYFFFGISWTETYHEWIVKKGVIIDDEPINESATYPAIWMIFAIISIFITILGYLKKSKTLLVFAIVITLFSFIPSIFIAPVPSIIMLFAFLIFFTCNYHKEIKKKNTAIYVMFIIVYITLMYFAF